MEEEDLNVIHMDEGGILIPSYRRYPHYIMTRAIPKRGIFYKQKTNEFLLKI